MKIGDKEFKVKITNKVIWDIEEHFDNEIINLITSDVASFKTKQMAELIHFGVRDEVSWDYLAENLKLNQYVECAKEVIEEITKSFQLKKN